MRAETLVATHTNTDFDAFAAMLAARRLYPGAIVCLAGSLNRNVREFYRLHADELDFVVDASRLELDAVRRLVVVETVHAARLGELEPLALDPAVDKVVFDHHGEEVPGWARAENVVISEDGALTTTLVGVLAEREVSVSPLEATVFALGIHEDTGSLTHTTTTQRDAEALGWCLRHAAEQELLSRFLHTPLGEPAHARDVMSKPPRTIAPEETVARAMVACQRFAQSGILVAAGDEVVGAVSREDLDKAISHGLSHAPVKGIMSSRVAACDEDTPLSELQRLLAGGYERVAVLRDGKLVGVVTRGDVLEALGERAAAPGRPTFSLADELAQLERLAPVFEAVAALSGDFEGVYLVGGTVRDILLRERSFDVDIAVEGDAIALAQTLADALGGRVRAHEKFGTAVVVYGDGERVDVVTARTEFYDAPASLPAVEHASIREDLFRRDFTINAMAVSLKGGDYGRLVDPFGGRADLDGKRIRVLHNLSFIDDPTRIFRAIRYENRYGFRMDEHTVRLARGTIEMGLVGDLSSARLRDELVALLEEGKVEHSILRLAELEADKAIHPHLAADDEAVTLLARLLALAQQYEIDVPAWRLGLIALARKLPPDEVYDWLQRLKVRRRDAEQIAAAVTVGPRIVERLRDRDVEPAEIVALADRYAPDAPLFALALAELEPLHEYFRGLRDIRLEVTGSDLAELGLGESPRVGEILAELRRRKLNGELDGRESELEAAREPISG